MGQIKSQNTVTDLVFTHNKSFVIFTLYKITTIEVIERIRISILGKTKSQNSIQNELSFGLRDIGFSIAFFACFTFFDSLIFVI